MEPSSTNCPIASSIFLIIIICLPRKVQSECFFLPALSKKYSLFLEGGKTIKVVGGYSEGVHLFPFRTEKLSSSALMVLPYGGRVSRRQPKLKRSCIVLQGLFFLPIPKPNVSLYPGGIKSYKHATPLGSIFIISRPRRSHKSLAILAPGGTKCFIVLFGPWRQHFLLLPFCPTGSISPQHLFDININICTFII